MINAAPEASGGSRDPIALFNEVEARYRRYLETMFYFKDPELRVSFHEALKGGMLTRGPYLEATPVFKRGSTAGDLIEFVLGKAPDPGLVSALRGDRALYAHQQRAIEKVTAGRNAVVATGTGSGKTEAFLYPILMHLYREHLAGRLGTGVRALVLYPMNALANDQKERLGSICRLLRDSGSPFSFTFGQYTGETPENENDTRRDAATRVKQREPGELVLRREMRETPPHLLLTNYSMLEYLLLRPDDSPLFDGGRAKWWTFIVLDEAHQYRGSKGTEMAMLLRRLKARLREGGREGPFRCIATSATLAGKGESEAVAAFAQDLFGEPFSEEDVIMGETEPLPTGQTLRLGLEDYRRLADWVQSDDSGFPLDGKGRPYPGLPALRPVAAADKTKTLGSILANDKRSAEIIDDLTGATRPIRDIAAKVFPKTGEIEAIAAVSRMVNLLSNAQQPSGAPLLSARYHFFLRSLEGAFASFGPQKKIWLERGKTDGKYRSFEIAICRECGQHYIVGKVPDRPLFDSGLQEAIRDPGDPNFGATFLRPLEDPAAEGEDGSKGRLFRLCTACGRIWPVRTATQQVSCSEGHEETILVEAQEGAEEREDQIPSCSACGYHGPDPVREIVHGNDGPHAVISTTLYQKAPEARRRILAFADSRQEAAFFAWYVEDSYKSVLSRNMLLRALGRYQQRAPDGLSIEEFAEAMKDALERYRIFPQSTGRMKLLKEGWLRVLREFLTDEQRISLEGLGLARWRIEWPAEVEPPASLLSMPWGLTAEEAMDVVATLMQFVRQDKAVALGHDAGELLTWGDLGLLGAQRRVRPGEPRGDKAVRSWDGHTGRRYRYLRKFLERVAPGISPTPANESVQEVLEEIWDETLRVNRGLPMDDEGIMIPSGDGLQLNPVWWRVLRVPPSSEIGQCDRCGRLVPTAVRGVCPSRDCQGTVRLVALENLEPDHYRTLYQEDLPTYLRAEEHTAQIDPEKARQFQQDFKAGKINILSSSTTFELGVDLGDLDLVFLRNVPPEAFNYAQRVGRAGRRMGFPGIAVTYARRGAHDLYHFNAPERMIRGVTRAPVLSLANEKIVLRHAVAVVLSDYFRSNQGRFVNVEELLARSPGPTFRTDILEHIQANRSSLKASLGEVLPESHTRDLVSDRWIEEHFGAESRLAQAEAEAHSDLTRLEEVKAQASRLEDYQKARWAKERLQTLQREDVLTFLSRKAVIPKYGFPVDVVELDTHRVDTNQESRSVRLERDLAIAISEFAPTSSLVANKKVWMSHGLKTVIGKTWDRKYYKLCRKHGYFATWSEGEPEPRDCGCRLERRQYVIPRFGFITNERHPSRSPTQRPTKVFSTRPYFIDDPRSKPTYIEEIPGVRLTKASPGMMAVICEGRRGEGFYICRECGAGMRVPKKEHESPYGDRCSGQLERLSIGQEFVTDVVRAEFTVPPSAISQPPHQFAYALAFALVEGGAQVLDIPPTDLNATVSYRGDAVLPPIIIYDNVPGGAGLVARFEDKRVFRAVLEAARSRLDGRCGCAPDSGCYGCLRSYYNQFAHQWLQRGPAFEYLGEVLDREGEG